MNYFNNGDKVYTVGDIDRLERENAELKLQVDQLLSALDDAFGYQGEHCPDWIYDKCYKAINDCVNEKCQANPLEKINRARDESEVALQSWIDEAGD